MYPTLSTDELDDINNAIRYQKREVTPLINSNGVNVWLKIIIASDRPMLLPISLNIEKLVKTYKFLVLENADLLTINWDRLSSMIFQDPWHRDHPNNGIEWIRKRVGTTRDIPTYFALATAVRAAIQNIYNKDHMLGDIYQDSELFILPKENDPHWDSSMSIRRYIQEYELDYTQKTYDVIPWDAKYKVDWTNPNIEIGVLIDSSADSPIVHSRPAVDLLDMLGILRNNTIVGNSLLSM